MWVRVRLVRSPKTWAGMFTGCVEAIQVCFSADHMSRYTSEDCQVPQTSRQEKKATSRTMPLYHWALLPVMLSLSRNQWMLRNGLESS